MLQNSEMNSVTVSDGHSLVWCVRKSRYWHVSQKGSVFVSLGIGSQKTSSWWFQQFWYSENLLPQSDVQLVMDHIWY